jgi:hypothetical protein
MRSDIIPGSSPIGYDARRDAEGAWIARILFNVQTSLPLLDSLAAYVASYVAWHCI